MSFTGRVISKRHPEIEKLFLKPGSQLPKEKNDLGKKKKKGGTTGAKGKSSTAKKTKPAGKETSAGQKIEDGNGVKKKGKNQTHDDASKPSKDMNQRPEVASPEDQAAAAAFEAWCQRQNQHFDDCESFELSIEIESTE